VAQAAAVVVSTVEVAAVVDTEAAVDTEEVVVDMAAAVRVVSFHSWTRRFIQSYTDFNSRLPRRRWWIWRWPGWIWRWWW